MLEHSTDSLLDNLVQGINNNVDASAAVVAVVNANLGAIKDAFDVATTNLLATTVGAAGGVAGAAATFGVDKIGQLTTDVQTIIQLVKNIKVTFGIIATNLAPGKYLQKPRFPIEPY